MNNRDEFIELAKQVIETGIVLFDEFSKNESLAPAMAKFAAKIRDSMMAEGFTREESVSLANEAMKTMKVSK